MVPRAGRGTEGTERCGQPGLEGFLPAPAVTPRGERGWGAEGGGEGAPHAPGAAGGRPCCCGCCCRGGRSARAPGTGACGALARSASGLPAGPGRASRSCRGGRVGGSAPLRRGTARGGPRAHRETPPPRELAAPPGSRSPCPAATVGTLALPPRHSRPLGAVRGAQHPLLGDEEAPADVLPVQLQRGHVRPQVGPGLVAPQDPSPGLRCGGRERNRMSWGAQHCRAPSRVPPPGAADTKPPAEPRTALGMPQFVPGPLPGMPQSIPVPVLGCRGGHSPFTTAPSCRKRARTRTGAGHGPMAAVGSLRPGRGARQGWDSLLCPVWGRGEGGKEGEKEGVSAA